MKSIEERERIPEFYVEDGLSTKQIAEKVGLSVGAVGSVLNVRGVKLRSPKEGLRTRFPTGRFGNLASNWKGGRRVANKSGYIQIYKPDHPEATKQGYIMEHRWVIEQTVGRPVAKQEVVHHINGNTQDNRPENLQLMTRSEHVQLHFDAVKEVARLKKILDEHGIRY